MKKKQPPKKGLGKLQPEWKLPIWYLGLILVLLWLWQDTFVQFTVHTILYSDFKQYLSRGEVKECAVRETEITGRIVPRTQTVAPNQNQNQSTPTNQNRIPTAAVARRKVPINEPFLFRTVRVEDPKLVEELQHAGVEFAGVRPSFISQVMLAWV